MKNGYTAKETAYIRKTELENDYRDCEAKLKKIKSLKKEIEIIEKEYNKMVIDYRLKSVDRVLEYIRRTEITDEKELDTLLCHCQNKLNGNIDGTELDLK